LDVPSGFHDLFLASAGADASLIGLLFVALSISKDRFAGSQQMAQVSRVRAAAALTAFLNALTVSMFAMVPGIGVRWPTVIVAILGLAFVAGALLSLLRVRRSQPGALRDGVFLAGLVVMLVVQLVAGVKLILHPDNTGPVQAIAVIVIVCLLVGIARAWELIEGPSIGLRSVLVDIARTGWDEGHGSPEDKQPETLVSDE
jgi:hypothetical protein